MKTLNYTISAIIGLASLLTFLSGGFVMGLVLLLSCIIFFLFALIEELNKELSDLKEAFAKFKDHYMVD